MNLEHYKKQIKLAAKARVGTLVYNGSIEHASILAETMFEFANDHVWILSEKLNARVYGGDSVLEQAELFLADPRHTVRILLEDGSEENRRDHPFFDKFERHPNVEVRSVPGALAKLYKFNLLSMDGDSYRFEADKSECAAVAAFGDKDGALHVERLFLSLWGECLPVEESIAESA